MRVERLLQIVKDLDREYTKSNLPTLLNTLQNSIQGQLNSPSASTQTQIAAARDAVFGALAKSSFYNLTPSLRRDLESMDLYDWTGARLESSITEALTKSGMVASDALKVIAEIAKVAADDAKAAKDLISALERFSFTAETLRPGEFELSVTIPRATFRNEVNALGKELSQLTYMFGVFSELATGGRENFKLNSISTTDPTILIASLPAVAALVITALDKVVSLYEKILNVRKILNDLSKQSVPPSITDQLKAHIEESIRKGIEEYADEVRDSYLVKTEAGRRAELDQELRRALWSIAERLDEGYDFDVRGRDVDDKNHLNDAQLETVRENLKVVNEARPRLQRFEAQEQPVLRISAKGISDQVQDY